MASTTRRSSTPPFDTLPSEIRVLIFSYVLSQPEPTITLCGCGERKDYNNCQKVDCNTPPLDPKLSLALVNKQFRSEVYHLAPTKQNIAVCGESCLYRTLTNSSWRFKRCLSAIVHSVKIKMPVAICDENEDQLIDHYTWEEEQAVRCYTDVLFQWWEDVGTTFCVRLDTYKSLMQVEVTFPLNSCRKCEVAQGLGYSPRFPLGRVEWDVEETKLKSDNIRK